MRDEVEKVAEEEVIEERLVIAEEENEFGDGSWPIVLPEVMSRFSFFPRAGDCGYSNHISPPLAINVDV
jgi:hypothetical protein